MNVPTQTDPWDAWMRPPWSVEEVAKQTSPEVAKETVVGRTCVRGAGSGCYEELSAGARGGAALNSLLYLPVSVPSGNWIDEKISGDDK